MSREDLILLSWAQGFWNLFLTCVVICVIFENHNPIKKLKKYFKKRRALKIRTVPKHHKVVEYCLINTKKNNKLNRSLSKNKLIPSDDGSKLYEFEAYRETEENETIILLADYIELYYKGKLVDSFCSHPAKHLRFGGFKKKRIIKDANEKETSHLWFL